MRIEPSRRKKGISLAAVIAVHAGLLMAAWHYHINVEAHEIRPLYVTFITEDRPAPKPPERKPRRIVAKAPVVKPEEPVAPPEPEEEPPVAEVPPAPAATPPPMLADYCVQRVPPAYPLAARRRGEQGQVVLRVTVDPRGRVSHAAVATSSGFASLDEAALAAVKRWQCHLPTHSDDSVVLTALQPFNFVLNKDGR